MLHSALLIRTCFCCFLSALSFLSHPLNLARYFPDAQVRQFRSSCPWSSREMVAAAHKNVGWRKGDHSEPLWNRLDRKCMELCRFALGLFSDGNPQQEQPRIGIIFRRNETEATEKAMYHEAPLPILLTWFMVCKSDASQCIAVLSPSQSCSQGLWFGILNQVEWFSFMIRHPKPSGTAQCHGSAS